MQCMQRDDLMRDSGCTGGVQGNTRHANAEPPLSMNPSAVGGNSTAAAFPSTEAVASGDTVDIAVISGSHEPDGCTEASQGMGVEPVDESTSAAADAEPLHLQEDVAGAASLAGPSPLELHHTQRQDTACTRLGIVRNGQQPWGLQYTDLDDPPAVELAEFQSCVIPTMGNRATVHARISARADLMYSAPVLVMPNGQRALPLGPPTSNRSRRARTAVEGAHLAGSENSVNCETLEECLGMHEDLEDGTDMDVSAWISEWNDRATWIQHLGDRARRKEIETPLPEALQQAALEERKNNKVLQWNHQVSEHEDGAGACYSL